MSEMLNNRRMHNRVNGKGNNVETALPSRCPTVQQGGPSCNPATASHQSTSRTSWTKELNKIEMKCCHLFKIKPKKTKECLLKFRNDTGIFQMSEQKLVGQALAIKNNGWISEMEMVELLVIRRILNWRSTSDEINNERKDRNRSGAVEDVNDKLWMTIPMFLLG